MRYTPATQITPANVRDLKVAWTYRIGEPSLLPEHPTNPADIAGLLAKGITPELKRMPALEATPSSWPRGGCTCARAPTG